MKTKLIVGSIIAVAIILLAPLSSVVAKSSVEDKELVEFDGNTIYVDDDNIEGPWDGTQEHPYKYIEDGIDASSDGDTVFVFNGEYKEGYLNIEKSIELIGEDKEYTIIDGNGYSRLLILKASGIKIDGFTIANSGDILVTMYQIEIYHAINIIISNNIIENGKSGGLFLADVSDSKILDNIIRNHDDSGISISAYYGRACNNLISGNHIENNYYGIYFSGVSGRIFGNFVCRNNFIENRITDSSFTDAAINFWIHNYWNQPGIKPVKIKGIVHILIIPRPYTNPRPVDITRYDWFPAQEPYDIDGGI